EEGPDGAERLDAAAGGEVGAIDLFAVAKEHAQAERLAVLVLARFGTLGADAEGVVEVALERGEPRDGPTHALPVGLVPGDRPAAALGGERVSRPRRLLFPRTQLLQSGFPLLLRDDGRKIHRDLLSGRPQAPKAAIWPASACVKAGLASHRCL